VVMKSGLRLKKSLGRCGKNVAVLVLYQYPQPPELGGYEFVGSFTVLVLGIFNRKAGDVHAHCTLSYTGCPVYGFSYSPRPCTS